MDIPSNVQREPRSGLRYSTPERLNFWYRLTAPAAVSPNASLAARELSRRGRLASQVIGVELIALLAVAIDVPLAREVLPSLLLALVCCAVAIALNRQGLVSATGWLLALSLDAALIWPVLTAPGGLDPIYIPVYYLMVVSPLIVAATVTPEMIVPITAINCLFIVLDIRAQPHTMMWDQMITSSAILYSMIVGPITLHIVAALLAYTWTRSATRALMRADRAEEIVRLEQREAEQRRRLEEGVQQILATHMRFANGDLAARVPAYQESVLWQVSVALNNLFARYQRLALEDGFSRMAAEQVGTARIALRQWQAGQAMDWPPAMGGPLDPLLADLRQVFSYLSPRLPSPGPASRNLAPWQQQSSYPAQPETRSGWPDGNNPPSRDPWNR